MEGTMSARGVRISGIVALATILIVPASAFLIGWVALTNRSGIEGALANVAVLVIVMYYAFVACAAFLLWATKQIFNASGYRSADLAIGTLFAVLAIVPPAAPLAWAWFAVLVTRFGRQVDSTLWQAIGIVYLLAAVLAAVGMTIFAGVNVPYLDELLTLSGLLLLAGWLCHGICLILGAREMAETDPGTSR